MYKPDKSKNEGLVKKLFRLTDSYINLSGYNTYPIPEKNKTYTTYLQVDF